MAAGGVAVDLGTAVPARAAWSEDLVIEAALHPISVRLYADAPYLHELYRQNLRRRIVHPANAPARGFSHPIHLGTSNRRWYLPGDATDLLLHTSCAVACCESILSHMPPLSDASDLGPPHFHDLAAGSFGRHGSMFAYWTHMESETRRRFQSGLSHIVMTDVSRCIESMKPEIMLGQLERVRACPDAIRILREMHTSWRRAGCRGLPLTGGFRLLIKLYMKDVDDRLRAEGIPFLRLQDDFRLFCRGEREGREAIGILSEALATVGLTLNRDKTMLLSKSQLRMSWQKLRLDWKRSFGRGVGFPLLSEALRVAPLRPPATRLLRVLYGNRWTPA